jgi:hypothetical protein
MTPDLPPHDPRRPPKIARSTVYKIAIIVILLVLAYCMWRVFTHLPPAQPLKYPADYLLVGCPFGRSL